MPLSLSIPHLVGLLLSVACASPLSRISHRKCNLTTSRWAGKSSPRAWLWRQRSSRRCLNFESWRPASQVDGCELYTTSHSFGWAADSRVLLFSCSVVAFYSQSPSPMLLPAFNAEQRNILSWMVQGNPLQGLAIRSYRYDELAGPLALRLVIAESLSHSCHKSCAGLAAGK